HIRDGPALELNIQDTWIKTATPATRTRHGQFGQQIQCDLLHALALAFLAAAAADVEAETIGLEAARLGFARGGEQLADFVEHAGVRRWRRTGRPAQRRLIDFDQFVDAVQSLDTVMRS